MVSLTMRYNPDAALQLAEPFDHPDSLATLRTICRLVSRRGRVPEMDDVRLDVVGRRTQTWIKT